MGNFLIYFFHPEHIGNEFLYALLTVSILYSILKKIYLWYNYSNITIPQPPKGEVNFKVDVLTTYFPGEPYQMIITTLEAMLNISYPHETFLCDEANDPYLKKFCRENGIIHVTRDNRINAKAGNINNALKTVAKGDVCVVLDPDHIPTPDFLDPILPYFNDPTTGFVQIVQSYYNIDESLVARGAAEQTFQFYGPVMMTLNSYGTVNAIGANCVFRRAALDSIGGHAPGLCEDMHTAMLLYSKGWKGIYLPVVLAKGLAPSNLTSFFKQQLKWSRGSFDLLIKVYPKIFKKLSLRQKIHFGILPMHYLSGLICLINFLIPILALFLSTTPWRGNVIEFALVILPVIASSVLIRTYIQKWIIEKKERGFHLVGGLLHINTWWIHLLGLYYTIIDRKIPYLPTPKEDEWSTNLKIIIPNAVIAVLSIIAILYGLNQDFTPFSLVMAGFAFFNACIMSFGILMAIRATNQNKLVQSSLTRKFNDSLDELKKAFYASANFVFNVSRILALPLLLLVLIFSMSFKQEKTREKWEEVEPTYYQERSSNYLGIFQPSADDGLADMEAINALESREEIDFDIVSFYLAWNRESLDDFPHQLTSSIFEKQAIPMITWEPWASGLPVSDTVSELKEEKKIFQYISRGYYDDYIRNFIATLKSYDKPFYLRFAHEFDNPQYPWSPKGENTPAEFVAAWKHVHDMLEEEGAYKVMMVWNPWKPDQMADYFPGEEYVDWIGVTALNYDRLNNNERYTTFSELYEPFHEELLSFTGKPVMLAEFGSLDLEGRQREWTEEAVISINREFEEIRAVVLFNSSFDRNIPENDFYSKDFLDWTMGSLGPIKEGFEESNVAWYSSRPGKDDHLKIAFQDYPQIRGVRYKKNMNWRQNYYALTKNEIQRDMELLRQANINTILYKGGNIYDYNIEKYSKASNINLLYSFNIDFTIDFLRDEKKLRRLRQDILDKVEDQKNLNNLAAYVFPGNMEDFFIKPELFAQRSAYLEWLKSLSTEIKEIDPEIPIIFELSLNDETTHEIAKVYEQLPVDAFGILVDDATRLNEVLAYAAVSEIPVFISSVNPESFIQNQSVFQDLHVVLQNWQNERLFNRLSFDGMLDFNGRKKRIFESVANVWSRTETDIDSTRLRILRPAVPLYPEGSATYTVAAFDGRSWKTVQDDLSSKYAFDWSLIKKDSYGVPLAIKKLGEGLEITIEIPHEYKRYELLLTAKPKDRDYVFSTRSPLHTPAEQPD